MELIRSILFFTLAVVIAADGTTTDMNAASDCDNDFEKCLVDRVLAKIKPEVTSVKDKIAQQTATLNQQKTQIEALKNRKEFRCESGTLTAYSWPTMPAWPMTKNVKFQTAFEQAPTVTYGLSLLDQDKENNLRVKVEVSNVSTAGFDMKVTQWMGSKLYGAYGTWMACGR